MDFDFGARHAQLQSEKDEHIRQAQFHMAQAQEHQRLAERSDARMEELAEFFRVFQSQQDRSATAPETEAGAPEATHGEAEREAA